VWRRRACKVCGGQFTTTEVPDYPTALVVASQDAKEMRPFNRDKLFMSLHRSLGHRISALDDATALTSTVIGRLLNKKEAPNGALGLQRIAHTSYEVLKRFDPLAAHTYKAYHQATLKKL
jgi:transcriptional regulator NrdR family protein